MTEHSTPSRRRFLGYAAAGVAAAGVAGTIGAGSASATPRPGGSFGSLPNPPWARRVPSDQISVQLYTLRDAIGTNPEPVLARLREIGYRKVELAGTYGLTAAAFRRMLDRNGLKATSSHVDVYGDVEAKAADAATLGCRFSAMPYAAFSTVAEWQNLADQVNTAADAFARVGVRYGYHNHDREFAALPGGRTGYDILLRETDRRLVHMELDLYWAAVAGVDPLRLFRADPWRYPQLHVKDRAPDGSFANLGEGTLDFRRVFKQAWVAGTVEYIVEHDQPSDPLRTVEVGYRYLRDLRL